MNHRHAIHQHPDHRIPRPRLGVVNQEQQQRVALRHREAFQFRGIGRASLFRKVARQRWSDALQRRAFSA
jgi:hypothetical protein